MVEISMQDHHVLRTAAEDLCALNKGQNGSIEEWMGGLHDQALALLAQPASRRKEWTYAETVLELRKWIFRMHGVQP